MRGCNFKIIIYFSLFVGTKEVMSKSFLHNTSLRTLHRKLEITFFQQSFLATLAWMCDVAVADNEKVVRTISETTKRSLGFFCQGSYAWTETVRVPVPEEAWMFPHAQETELESGGGVFGCSCNGGGAAALPTSFPYSKHLGKKMARFFGV
jgi:hypothetical protein